jgi:hypothetical protein
VPGSLLGRRRVTQHSDWRACRRSAVDSAVQPTAVWVCIRHDLSSTRRQRNRSHSKRQLGFHNHVLTRSGLAFFEDRQTRHIFACRPHKQFEHGQLGLYRRALDPRVRPEVPILVICGVAHLSRSSPPQGCDARRSGSRRVQDPLGGTSGDRAYDIHLPLLNLRCWNKGALESSRSAFHH